MSLYKEQIDDLRNILGLIRSSEFEEKIELVVHDIYQCFQNSGKLVFFGNGGSSMDGAHIAAEFSGRFLLERPSLPAISLSDNVAAVTSIANDFGYENVFARQIEGLASPGDFAIGLSTSGRSPNVLKGLETATKHGMKTLIFTKEGATFDGKEFDHVIGIPSASTARIQEATLFLGHFIAGEVEKRIYD